MAIIFVSSSVQSADDLGRVGTAKVDVAGVELRCADVAGRHGENENDGAGEVKKRSECAGTSRSLKVRFGWNGKLQQKLAFSQRGRAGLLLPL